MNFKDEKVVKTVSTAEAVEEASKQLKTGAEPKAEQEPDLDSSLEEDTEGLYLRLLEEQERSRRAEELKRQKAEEEVKCILDEESDAADGEESSDY